MIKILLKKKKKIEYLEKSKKNYFLSQKKFKKKKSDNNAILLVSSNEEISLWPELSSPPRFRIHWGVPWALRMTKDQGRMNKQKFLCLILDLSMCDLKANKKLCFT